MMNQNYKARSVILSKAQDKVEKNTTLEQSKNRDLSSRELSSRDGDRWLVEGDEKTVK